MKMAKRWVKWRQIVSSIETFQTNTIFQRGRIFYPQRVSTNVRPEMSRGAGLFSWQTTRWRTHQASCRLLGVRFCLRWFPLGLLTNKCSRSEPVRAGPTPRLLSCLISSYLPAAHWATDLRRSSLIAGCGTSHILRSCCVSVVVVFTLWFFILCCCFCVCFVSLCIFLYLCWHFVFLWLFTVSLSPIVSLNSHVVCLCLLFQSLCLYLSSSFVVVYCLPLVMCVFLHAFVVLCLCGSLRL